MFLRMTFPAFVLLSGLLSMASAGVPNTFKIDATKIPKALKPSPDYQANVVAVLEDREGVIDQLAFSPDGKYLAMTGPNLGLRIWNLSTWKLVGTLPLRDITSLGYTLDGRQIACGDRYGNLRFILLNGPKPVVRTPIVPAHADGPLYSLAFRPNGKTIATGGKDGDIRLWDIATGKLTATLKGHAKYVRGIAFTPDGDWLASAGADDLTLRIWDVSAMPPEQIEVVETPKAIASVSLSADGTRLAAAVFDGKIRLYKTDQSPPKEMDAITAPRNILRFVQFAPDGFSLLGVVRGEIADDVFWWKIDGTVKREFKFRHKIEGLVWAPDGKHFATANEESVYIVATGE